MKRRVFAVFVSALAACAALQAAQRPKADRVKVIISWNNDNNPGHVPVKGAELGGDDVAEYENYRIVALPEAAVARLDNALRPRGLRAQRRDDFDVIHLPGALIDARRGLDPQLPVDQLVSGYAGAGLYVVQLIGPATPQWTSGLTNAGAKIVNSVPQNAYLVIASDAQAAAIDKLAYVQFLTPYHPLFKAKVDVKSLTNVVVEVAADSAAEALQRVRGLDAGASEWGQLPGRRFVKAQLGPAAAAQLLRDPLVIGIGPFLAPHISDERQAMSVSSNVDSLTLPNRPTNPTTYESWLASACPICANLPANFVVGIADTGVDGGDGAGSVHHPDLPASRIAYGADLVGDHVTADTVAHGTMVAGIIAAQHATNARDNGTLQFFLGQGIAPSAHIFSTRAFPNGFATVPVQQWVDQAVANGVTIQNHSNNLCSTNVEGRYMGNSPLDDGFVRDTNGATAGGAPITLTVSAGNRDDLGASGSCLGPWVTPGATAKNVIAVGGTENFRDDPNLPAACRGANANGFSRMMSYGKHGTRVANVSPDGMVHQWSTYIKPDLVAPASLIISEKSNGAGAVPYYCVDNVYNQPDHQQYVMESGTSFAAPVAAGAALLGSRLYAEFVQPGVIPVNPALASPSLLKAMLIGSARSIEGGVDTLNNNAAIGPRPNDVQGFGLVSIVDMVDTNAKSYVNQTYRFTTSGEASFHGIYYHRNMSAPARAVLTWTDAPAQADDPNNQIANPPLVNDLDLYVNKPFARNSPIVGGGHLPCSVIYYGNNVGSGDAGQGIPCMASVIGLGQDYRNTAEIVPIPATSTFGLLDVSVAPKQISAQADPNVAGNNQDFSLYVYNASQRGDFNRDGRPDLIWRKVGVDQAPMFWTLRDGSTTATLNAALPSSWNIEAVGDFDLNGSDDLVVRDTTSGALYIGEMTDLTYTALVTLPTLPDTNWMVAGAGDMNLDGNLDLVIRNTVTGENRIWYFVGTTFDSSANLQSVPDANWHLEGVADFNNDGKPDLLWHNWAYGNLAIWQMDNTTLVQAVAVSPTVSHSQWTIGAVGDYNYDSMNDIVWRNASSGQVLIWWGTGHNTFPTWLSGPVYSDLSWQIAGPR